MWLVIALIGYALLAIVAIMDKLIVAKHRLAPSSVAMYSTAPLLIAFLFLPFGVLKLTSSFDGAVALVSGATFVVGLYAMYRCFAISEVSHSGPLVGAATAIGSVLASRWFLFERISERQLMAIGLLVVGSLIISIVRGKRKIIWSEGIGWGLIAGLGFALSNVAAKYFYTRYGFYSGLVWTRGMIGLAGLALFAVPSVRHNVRMKKSVAAATFQTNKKPFHAGVFLALDKILGVSGVLLIQYAIALGSVAIVNALAGVQYALLIVLAVVLSKFSPQFFREDHGARELAQEGFAIITMAAGLALLIM